MRANEITGLVHRFGGLCGAVMAAFSAAFRQEPAVKTAKAVVMAGVRE